MPGPCGRGSLDSSPGSWGLWLSGRWAGLAPSGALARVHFLAFSSVSRPLGCSPHTRSQRRPAEVVSGCSLSGPRSSASSSQSRTLAMTWGRLRVRRAAVPPSLLPRRPSPSQVLGVTSLVAVAPSPAGDKCVMPQSATSLFPVTCFFKKGLEPGDPRSRLGKCHSLVHILSLRERRAAVLPTTMKPCPDCVTLGKTKQEGRYANASKRVNAAK